MKVPTAVLVIVLMVGGLLVGIAVAKWMHASPTTTSEGYSHPISSGDPVYEVKTATGEVVKRIPRRELKVITCAL